MTAHIHREPHSGSEGGPVKKARFDRPQNPEAGPSSLRRPTGTQMDSWHADYKSAEPYSYIALPDLVDDELVSP